MEGSCSLKALVSGVCDFSDKDRKREKKKEQTGELKLAKRYLKCNYKAGL